MPSAIHLGLRRPGIRGGCGVAGSAADAAFCFCVFPATPRVRGSVSMVMVSSLNVGGIVVIIGNPRWARY